MQKKSFSGILLMAVLASAHATAADLRAEASHPSCVPSDVVTASWEDARRSGVEFRAVGLAPSWTLELGQGQCLHFIDHDSARLISASMPEPLSDVRSGGLLYAAHSETLDLQVGIERRVCSSATNADAMSHTVVIRVDGKEYTGCGRALPGQP